MSPCQAGCKSCEIKALGQKKAKEIKLYSKCSCVTETNTSVTHSWPKSWPDIDVLPPASALNDGSVHHAFSGYCPSSCQKQFFYFIGILGLTGFVFTGNRLPALLVFMRAVEPRDKTTAFTFIVSFISMFSLIPGPIIYGAIFDSACIIWGKECGETQNCLVYDTNLLRTRAASFSVVCFIIALCCEFGIFYYAKKLNIYRDKAESESEIEQDGAGTTIDNISSNSTNMDRISSSEEQNKCKH